MKRIAWFAALAVSVAACMSGKQTETDGPFVVCADGRQLRVQPARTSAFPLNQLWPGYQRPLGQTKMGYFVTVDLDRAAELSVDFGGRDVPAVARIRPLSHVQPRREGNSWRVSLEHPEQFVLEFPGKGGDAAAPDLHVFVNEPFRYRHVPGEIYFGPGEHDAGLIVPKSGQTVCIDEGAVVYGSICAWGAKDVTITGRGVLDSSRVRRCSGNRAVMAALSRIMLDGASPQRDGTQLTLYSCTNVTVSGIIFRDAPFWSVIVRNESKNVSFDNIKVVGQWRYNSDGVDVCASEDVTLRNSFVRSFDDCVVARGALLPGGEHGPLRNFTVENCVLWCDWGKNLEVWAGRRSCIIDGVVFRNCKCVQTDHAVCDVTTWTGAPEVAIRNVLFENIEVDRVSPTWRGQFQRKDAPDEKFVPRPREDLNLLIVDFQPNAEVKADIADCRVVYENIRFSGATVLGDAPRRISVSLGRDDKRLSIRGMDLEGLPPGTSVRRRGDIR